MLFRSASGVEAAVEITGTLGFNDATQTPQTISLVGDASVYIEHLPIADAGADMTVGEGSPATLHGESSSDQEGAIVSFGWVQTAGPEVALSGGNTAAATFTAPEVGAAGAILTFVLTVADSAGQTRSDALNVFVSDNPLSNDDGSKTMTATRRLPDWIAPGEPVSVAVDLHVEGETPNGLIVTEMLPVGSTLLTSTPTYASYNAETGEIKWLFTADEIVSRSISYTFSPPASGVEAAVEIGRAHV